MPQESKPTSKPDSGSASKAAPNPADPFSEKPKISVDFSDPATIGALSPSERNELERITLPHWQGTPKIPAIQNPLDPKDVALVDSIVTEHTKKVFALLQTDPSLKSLPLRKATPVDKKEGAGRETESPFNPDDLTTFNALINRKLTGLAIDDEKTRAAIRETYLRYNFLTDDQHDRPYRNMVENKLLKSFAQKSVEDMLKREFKAFRVLEKLSLPNDQVASNPEPSDPVLTAMENGDFKRAREEFMEHLITFGPISRKRMPEKNPLKDQLIFHQMGLLGHFAQYEMKYGDPPIKQGIDVGHDPKSPGGSEAASRSVKKDTDPAASKPAGGR